MTPSLTLIVAYSDNRAIGRDNALPWRLPGIWRISSAARWVIPSSWAARPGILWGGRCRGAPISSSAAIRISRRKAPSWWRRWKRRRGLRDVAEAFVIGGAQIYAQALPLARRVLATEVHARVEGDAFFPLLPAFQWKETARERQPAENGYEYDFVTYERA